eukprot:scaffold8896_cov67-Phaeocystis_antarctica.AAC.2
MGFDKGSGSGPLDSVKSAPSSDENNVSIPRHPPSLLALSAHGLPLLPANLVDAVILAPGKPQHGSWQTHALAAAPEILAHQVALAPSAPAAALARADSSATSQKKKMLVRRHSSGDHAFLPNRQETAAKNLAARGGVQPGHMQDSEVSRAASLASRSQPPEHARATQRWASPCLTQLPTARQWNDLALFYLEFNELAVCCQLLCCGRKSICCIGSDEWMVGTMYAFC